MPDAMKCTLAEKGDSMRKRAYAEHKPWKVRRVGKKLYQVCFFGILSGVDPMPGYVDNLKSAQEFADALNSMRKEVVLHA